MMVRTHDANLAFMVSQLEALDKKLYEPLFNVTWARDIKLRSDVTLAHDSTSFIRANFSGNGANELDGMPFIAPNATSLEGVAVTGEKVVLPMRLLGREIAFSSVELDRSQLLGMPIEQQKFNALNADYQLSTDKMVYVGNEKVGAKGLLNNGDVTIGNAAKTWKSATADEILDMVNTAIETAWKASGYNSCPDTLLLPPAQFALIAGKKVGDAGNESILTFIENNAISLRLNGNKIKVNAVKHLAGIIKTGNKDRMVVYSNQEDKVRFPLVPIRRETAYYHGINYIAPYIWAFGEVEFIYPETAYYCDGI